MCPNDSTRSAEPPTAGTAGRSHRARGRYRQCSDARAARGDRSCAIEPFRPAQRVHQRDVLPAHRDLRRDRCRRRGARGCRHRYRTRVLCRSRYLRAGHAQDLPFPRAGDRRDQRAGRGCRCHHDAAGRHTDYVGDQRTAPSRSESTSEELPTMFDDVREGVDAFLEKRDPEFPNRVPDGLPDLFSWVSSFTQWPKAPPGAMSLTSNNSCIIEGTH